MADRKLWYRAVAIALAFATIMSVSMLATETAPFGSDQAGIVLGLLASLGTGFLVALGLLLLNLKLVAWWRRRLPEARASVAMAGPGGTVAPFRWTGRTTHHAWGMFAFLAFFVGLSLLVLYGQGPGTPMGNFTLAIILLMAFVVATAFAFAFRKKTFVIDDSGIVLERGFRSDVHVRWSEVKEIGIAKFPLADWAAPFSVRELPKMIVLRGQDGGPLGILQPAGEAPPGISERIEAAVRAQAAAHGVPVRDLGFREMAAWRKPKRPSILTVRSP